MDDPGKPNESIPKATNSKPKSPPKLTPEQITVAKLSEENRKLLARVHEVETWYHRLVADNKILRQTNNQLKDAIRLASKQLEVMKSQINRLKKSRKQDYGQGVRLSPAAQKAANQGNRKTKPSKTTNKRENNPNNKASEQPLKGAMATAFEEQRISESELVRQERSQDASKDYYRIRDHGQFGSHPTHDIHEEYEE